MARLRRILHFIDATNEWSGKIVCYLIVGAIIVLLYEIFVRYLFNSPTNWAHEVSRHFYGAYFMLGAGYALYHRMHVRTDVILRCLSPRVQSVVEVVTSLFFFYCVGLLLWKGGEMAWSSVLRQETTTGTVFRSPVWPVKLAIPIGAFLLLMQGVAKVIRDTYHIVTKETLA